MTCTMCVHYLCTSFSLDIFYVCNAYMYIETQIQCLAWQNKNGSSERNKAKYKTKKMCSTKMNARSSTSFGICIFHLSLQIGRSKEWTMLDAQCSKWYQMHIERWFGWNEKPKRRRETNARIKLKDFARCHFGAMRFIDCRQ